MLNWRHQRPTLTGRQSVSTSPVQPQAVTLFHVDPRGGRQSLRTDDPRSSRPVMRSDTSPSTSTYTPPPPTLMPNMPLQSLQSKPDDNGDDDMPILMKNEDTSLGDFLGWVPKY
jgi:hypothetical protein